MRDYYTATKDIAILYSKTGLNPQHYGAFIVGYLNPNDSIVYKNPSFSSLDYGAYELGKLLGKLAAKNTEGSSTVINATFNISNDTSKNKDEVGQQINCHLYDLAKRLDERVSKEKEQVQQVHDISERVEVLEEIQHNRSEVASY